MSTWALVGVSLAILGALVALRNARRPPRSAVATDYGMTARSHGRFALLSGAFTVVFVCAALVAWLPAVPLLAIYVLCLILYAASFARGHADA